ncbi:MAG: hypothetical protein FWD35_05690 [Oscillospiraceae bacterium]|nr:hypothetical protein [Oscillospiraceae bacterium]
MRTYTAYCEKGRIVPVGNPVIPEGRTLIITVLDESLFANHFTPKVREATLSSEMSLSKMWLSPEEDEAWADL